MAGKGIDTDIESNQAAKAEGPVYWKVILACLLIAFSSASLGAWVVLNDKLLNALITQTLFNDDEIVINTTFGRIKTD